MLEPSESYECGWVLIKMKIVNNTLSPAPPHVELIKGEGTKVAQITHRVILSAISTNNPAFY